MQLSGLVLFAAANAVATPIELTVDPARSSANVMVCVSVGFTVCDSDTSPITGQVVAGVDCFNDPKTLGLYDFRFLLTDQIDLNLSFSFTGRLDATLRDVEILHGEPGIPRFGELAGTQSPWDFSIPDVPVDARGQAQYNATGLVCTAIQASGQSCSSTIDLASLELSPVAIPGTLRIDGRQITLNINFDVRGPLIPSSPNLAVATITGAIVAHGVMPLPDMPTFIAALNGNAETLDAACEADINNDGYADGRDVSAYVYALLH